MMYWNINEAGNTSPSLPSGANTLNDLADVAIASPVAGQILKYDGSQFSNADNNIDANQITTGTLAYSRLPNLSEITLSGDGIPPYISFITPITPNGSQDIEILGEYFSPITQLNIPGVVVNNLEVRSPNKIIANISKSNLSGNKIITLSNGANSNQLWSEGIKNIDIYNDPYWASVVLYLRGDGENNAISIIDSSPSPKAIARVSDTKISTAQSKYGGSSIYFNGAGDALILPASNDFNFSGDFTIEFWYYHHSAPQTYARLFKQRQGDVFGGLDLIFNNATQIGIYYSTNNYSHNIIAGTVIATLTTLTWYHIALSCSSNTFRIFVNGAITYTLSNFPTYNNSANIGSIGGQETPSRSINGYIDSFRITKGIGRYTSAFNPESGTYLNA